MVVRPDNRHALTSSVQRLTRSLRHRLRGGLRAACWREAVRPRILRTIPVRDTVDPRCEIHALTSSRDWLNLIWALKSFYHYSQRRYRLCIHDDGSLGAERIGTLAAHFPQARIVVRAQAEASLRLHLDAYPRCQELCAANRLALKVFGFACHLAAERMLVLDSDVLFFAQPVAMLSRIEDTGYRKNVVNRDAASMYTAATGVLRAQSGVALIDRFNSGLGLIHEGSIRVEWVEEFLALPGLRGHPWMIEQTLYALCSSRHGAELLPEEYDIRLAGAVGTSPCRHYVGPIRGLLYTEGLARLRRAGFLRALRSACEP